MKNFLQQYSEKFASRWLVFGLDIVIITIAFISAVILRFNFELTYIDPTLFKYHITLVVLVKISVFIYLKSYSGIIRHTSIEDTKILFKACFFAALELMILGVPDWTNLQYFKIPVSILLIDFFISLFALVFSRLVVKGLYDNLIKNSKSHVNILIYGAGHLGITTKNTLLKDKKKKYEILGFIDDNPNKIQKSIEGIRVFSKKEALENYITGKEADPNLEVVFAIQSIESTRKTKIIEEFLDLGVVIKSIPPIEQWISGELRINQIQNIKIEDLLEREPIKISNHLVKHFIQNKIVMVTGAAGSIGSELVRQLIRFNPQKIILIDQAESPLYDLETELLRLENQDIQKIAIRTEVASVSNVVYLEKIFVEEKPQVIFHAAAYKHVPMMEKNPYRAVSVNVLGTQIVADLASKYGVEKFVMISTDKAVNPTNVMGASKRLAEMYVQSLNGRPYNHTRFIITRFGNVLGSNGSVVPLFKKQIENGGPLTVTHPDIIRYFMTIPEACQLVLEACTMGKGGEVYVFDMGEPVKIVDLARKMVQLSGLELDKDIAIQFTGLREGEKLYEELLNDNENTLPTYHTKIMIARVMPEDYGVLSKGLGSFKEYLLKGDFVKIVAHLKSLVPEYVSNNSVYEQLDNTKSETSSYTEIDA